MTTPLTPKTYRLLPEWAPQKVIWTAWPASPHEWNGDLVTPRRDVAALVRALAPANTVRLLANGAESEQTARAALGDAAQIVPAAYGDIWLRDTGPIFAVGPEGTIALRFRTNGWGGKHELAGDDTVGDAIAEAACVPTKRFDFILEGGAIDHDGAGTILTTRQTLLNENRYGWTQQQAEAALAGAFGIKKIVWLDQGIEGDHTDGHVDNLARFVAPGQVVCQSSYGDDDPNAGVLEAAAAQLKKATDADERPLDVIRIPSPGRVIDAFGQTAPASYMNFVIANGVVVVPVYGSDTEQDALEALQAVFPDRKVVGLSASGVLGAGDAGGGAFHCMTCEEPEPETNS